MQRICLIYMRLIMIGGYDMMIIIWGYSVHWLWRKVWATVTLLGTAGALHWLLKVSVELLWKYNYTKYKRELPWKYNTNTQSKEYITVEIQIHKVQKWITVEMKIHKEQRVFYSLKGEASALQCTVTLFGTAETFGWHNIQQNYSDYR